MSSKRRSSRLGRSRRDVRLPRPTPRDVRTALASSKRRTRRISAAESARGITVLSGRRSCSTSARLHAGQFRSLHGAARLFDRRHRTAGVRRLVGSAHSCKHLRSLAQPSHGTQSQKSDGLGTDLRRASGVGSGWFGTAYRRRYLQRAEGGVPAVGHEAVRCAGGVTPTRLLVWGRLHLSDDGSSAGLGLPRSRFDRAVGPERSSINE